MLFSLTPNQIPIIDRDSIHPTAEKVRAIQEARTPQNISELRSFFGIIDCFLLNLSIILAPLYHLLQKDVKWTWEQEQEEAFTTTKKALQDNSLLVHYDESKPLILACDASQYGLGVCHRTLWPMVPRDQSPMLPEC